MGSSLSSHNFRVEVVSQILCWVGIFICRLAVFKMYAAHSRRILWSPNFSFPYFPFNILRPSSSSFAIFFLRGKGKKLEWWLAVAGMCPVQTYMKSTGLFRHLFNLSPPLGSQQQHNSGARIPYLEKKSKRNDYRLETFHK